ncbi:MAG: hypothetical protein WHT06_09980 [Desulfobacterales bacterium]
MPPFRLIAAGLLVLCAAGCLHPPAPFETGAPAWRAAPLFAAPPVDGRARFREILCRLADARLAAGEARRVCSDLLWRLADEAPSPAPPASPPPHDPRLRLLIVPGAFTECFPGFGRPFEDAAPSLAARGYRIDWVPVAGRSGSGENAARIAAFLRDLPPQVDERLVLIGHSKGAVDILEFLDAFRPEARRVSAAVAVAGPVAGSRLAERFARLYERLLSRVALGPCPPGDGKVLESLGRNHRLERLAGNPAPEGVLLFSLGAFTRREATHPLLLFSHDLISPWDPRNDGLVAHAEQVIPGSVLLGWANLDHWDVALPVRERLNFGGAGSRAAERRLLFEALVLAVGEALGKGGG